MTRSQTESGNGNPLLIMTCRKNIFQLSQKFRTSSLMLLVYGETEIQGGTEVHYGNSTDWKRITWEASPWKYINEVESPDRTRSIRSCTIMEDLLRSGSLHEAIHTLFVRSTMENDGQ